MTDAIKPVPPKEPAPGECCGTGCIPCVMDLYQEALDEYELKLAKWTNESNASDTNNINTAKR
jgi:hypothetical protein